VATDGCGPEQNVGRLYRIYSLRMGLHMDLLQRLRVWQMPQDAGTQVWCDGWVTCLGCRQYAAVSVQQYDG